MEDENYYKYLKYKSKYLSLVQDLKLKNTIGSQNTSADENNKRPSPTSSATLYKTGTKKDGNDGNQWIVVENKKGIKRWQLHRKMNYSSENKDTDTKTTSNTDTNEDVESEDADTSEDMESENVDMTDGTDDDEDDDDEVDYETTENEETEETEEETEDLDEETEDLDEEISDDMEEEEETNEY